MTRVLLVDDEELFRTNLAKRLRKRGYDVVDVDNGIDAVKRARADYSIEVAILDLNMPNTDGMQTLNDSLYQLYVQRQVTLEECIRVSSDPTELKRMVGAPMEAAG